MVLFNCEVNMVLGGAQRRALQAVVGLRSHNPFHVYISYTDVKHEYAKSGNN
jgi:hypothetical protein